MAKRKCPHKKVTRGKEMSIPVGLSYRHSDPDPIVAVRICEDCGEWLSVGRSVDQMPDAQVEIRAAEVGQHAEVWSRFMDLDGRIATDLRRVGAHGTLSLGALSPDAGHAYLDPPPRWTPGEAIDYWAGWLAREIAEHDELQDDDALPPVSRGRENEGRCEGCREPIREGEDCPEKAATDDIPIRCGAPEVIDLTPRQARAQMADGVAVEGALIDEQAKRVTTTSRHADFDDDHLDGCTTDVCAPGCVTDPAAKFGEQARRVTLTVRWPEAADQMELPVVSEATLPPMTPDIDRDEPCPDPVTCTTCGDVPDGLRDPPPPRSAVQYEAARLADPDCHDENGGPSDDAGTVTLREGDASWHDGPGWYYTIDDYPDEGACGAFASRVLAAQHARLAGHIVDGGDS